MAEELRNTFPQVLALWNGRPYESGTAQIFAPADDAFTDPLQLQELDGTPIGTTLTADINGVFPAFVVDSITDFANVVAKSTDFTLPMISVSGNRGADGIGIENVELDVTGNLIITLTSGAEINVGNVRGPAGSGVDTAGAADGAYLRAVTAGGDTYWDLGPREIELQATPTHVQKRYQGDAAWTNLFALPAAGESPQLRINAGRFEYKLPSQTTWTDLGPVPANGESPQLRANGGYLQYKLPSQTTWTNIIALADIGGSGSAGGLYYVVDGEWQDPGSFPHPAIFVGGMSATNPWPPFREGMGDHYLGLYPPLEP